jgi:DNA-binding MarR family transcriptional regulator
MKSFKSKARELSAHFRVIREKLHSIDKHNAATRQFLNFQEAHLLMSLGTKGPLTMSEVAQTLQLKLSSVTALIDKLETKAFVRRVRTARDRRLVRVELTRQGSKFHDLVESAHLQLTGSMLRILNPAERETLLALFRKIAQSLNK